MYTQVFFGDHLVESGYEYIDSECPRGAGVTEYMARMNGSPVLLKPGWLWAAAVSGNGVPLEMGWVQVVAAHRAHANGESNVVTSRNLALYPAYAGSKQILPNNTPNTNGFCSVTLGSYSTGTQTQVVTERRPRCWMGLDWRCKGRLPEYTVVSRISLPLRNCMLTMARVGSKQGLPNGKTIRLVY
ncbi:hypothetical protein PM082_009197 [Marasmius tenuissimus]|nr:hypothetical protein PM082_009197 [Marasmius tenuissimus]